jgi:hypothetical protein
LSIAGSKGRLLLGVAVGLAVALAVFNPALLPFVGGGIAIGLAIHYAPRFKDLLSSDHLRPEEASRSGRSRTGLGVVVLGLVTVAGAGTIIFWALGTTSSSGPPGRCCRPISTPIPVRFVTWAGYESTPSRCQAKAAVKKERLVICDEVVLSRLDVKEITAPRHDLRCVRPLTIGEALGPGWRFAGPGVGGTERYDSVRFVSAHVSGWPSVSDWVSIPIKDVSILGCLRLQPDRGSKLELDVPHGLVESTDPESKPALGPLGYAYDFKEGDIRASKQDSSVSLRILSPWVRDEPLREIANLSSENVTKWLIGVLLAFATLQMKGLLGKVPTRLRTKKQRSSAVERDKI